jgi:hypothetical protein
LGVDVSFTNRSGEALTRGRSRRRGSPTGRRQ